MKPKSTPRAVIALWMFVNAVTHCVNAQTAPSFTRQPLSCSYPPGIPVFFSVNTTGTTPMFYQWTLNGSPINNATNSTYTTAPITLNDLGSYSVIVSNSAGTVTSSNALVTFGPVACWGSTSDSSSPPPNLTNVTAIASASRFSCSLQSDGSIVTWGSTTAPTLTNAVAISASSGSVPDMGLALLADGTVVGWGGATIPPNATNIVAISAGESSLFLRNDGTVLSSPGAAPAGLANIVAISSGLQQNLALRSDGTVVAWNSFGDKTAATNVPPGLRNVVGIGVGFDHGVALKSDGHVVAWRGTLAKTNATNIPPLLTTNGAPQVIAIATGGKAAGSTDGTSSSLGLLTNGTVVAWGDNAVTNVPPALTNVVAVAVGANPALALVSDGRPLLLQAPVGGAFYKGRTAGFTARATGIQPLNYQWLFNGTNLPDATNAILQLPNFDIGNIGTYQLIVTNSLGTTTSLPVPLNLIDGPLYISSQPASSTNYLGRRVHLGGAVNGSRPMQMQWRYSPSSPPVWQDLPGATNEDLVIDPLRAADAGIYSFVANNAFGSITSSNAVIAVRQIVVWGDTSNNKTNVPSNLTNAIAIATDDNSSLVALRDNGLPQPWGLSTNVPVGISNLVEVACNYATFVGLRKDGKPVAWGYVPVEMSKALATLSNIVAINADINAIRCLRADGMVFTAAIDSSGAKLSASNVVAIGELAGTANYMILGDGRVVPGYSAPVSNAVATAGYQYQAVLRNDGSVLTLQRLNDPQGSNIVSIAGTGLGTLFAAKSDGTVTNWMIPSLVSSNIPADFYAPAAMQGGNNHMVAMYSSSPFPSMLLPQALDIDATVLSSENSAQWYGQTNMTHDGHHAAQSAQLGSNTASSMRTLITNGPITVTFWWKVSSETNNDTLTFSIGGIPQSSISGEVDWQQVSFTVPAGPQMLVWTYSKDGAGTAGLDAGFVDQLSITPIAPTISTQPSNLSVVRSNNATFSVTASGTAPLQYSWLLNGSNITGANASSFTITNAQSTNIGSYSVVVSNSAGTVASTDAVLIVNDPPAITTQPQSQTVVKGAIASLSVLASGTAPLLYQWHFNSADISGVTDSAFTLSSAQLTDAGSYSVTVSNIAGTVFSAIATLTVNDPVAITAQPQSQTISQNTGVTLSVAATGTAPLNYQWQFNGTDISNATNTSYKITSAQLSDTGSYSVVITNIANSVTSVAAVVTVNPCAIHVIETSTDTNGNIVMTWSTDSGINYTIQSKSDLTNAQWTTVTTSNAAANLITFIGVLTNSQQFYRLISDCAASEICGFLRIDFPANSDTIISTPFVRPLAGSGTVQSVTSNTITVTEKFPLQWSPNRFVYTAGTQSNTYYARFITGAAQGPNYPIVSNDASTLTIDPSSASLSAVSPGDHLVIEPYTTPNSLFPNGSGINISPTAGNRNTELLGPDRTGTGINLSATAIYFFNSGIWKQVGHGSTDRGNDIVPPNSWLIVRHNVSTNTTTILSGIADTSAWWIPLRTATTAQQDNAICLPRPTIVSLNDSGLIASGAFAPSPVPGSRTDELLTFDNALTAKNKSASAIYYYWSNAWRRVGLGTNDFGADKVFSPGTGVIIRKSPTSTPVIWTNAPPY